jgi:hypothetical protein
MTEDSAPRAPTHLPPRPALTPAQRVPPHPGPVRRPPPPVIVEEAPAEPSVAAPPSLQLLWFDEHKLLSRARGRFARYDDDDPEAIAIELLRAVSTLDLGALSEPTSSTAVRAEVIEGAYSPDYDALSTLRTTAGVLASRLSDPTALRREVEAYGFLFSAPWSGGGADVARQLARRLLALVPESDKPLAQREIRASLARARPYDRLSVFGGSRVPGTFELADQRVRAYLPEAAVAALPAFAPVVVRVLAEVHPRQEDLETGSVALEVIALARVLGADAA